MEMSMAIELKITLDQETGVQVAGPIQDKILSYGMLEFAKDAIRDHHKSSIVKQPGNGIMKFIRRK